MTVMELELNELFIEPSVQRVLNMAFARKIAKEFDPAKLGVITVVPREEGGYNVADGQTRVAALKIRKKGERVTATVLPAGMTLADQADAFLGLNDRRSVTSVEKFNVRVTRGDTDAVAVDRVLKRFGWQVKMGMQDGSTAAVEALRSVAAHSEFHLERIVAVATHAWNMDVQSLRRTMVYGMGKVLDEHPELDTDHLISSLKTTTPGSLLARANAARDQLGTPTRQAITSLIIAQYNKNLSAARRLKNDTPHMKAMI